MPSGYTTAGPTTAFNGSPEFYAALPAAVPVAYISFTMGSGPAGPYDTIAEALAQGSSAQAATNLLKKVNDVASQCGFTGTSIDLPGSVPGLIAFTNPDGGQRGELISSAIVFTTKSSYVLEVRWFNSLDIYNTGVTGPQPALPTPAIMGSIVDAALAHIPD